MSELNTSAGGIHPGKPIIWPTVKPTPTSTTQTQQTEQSQTQSTQTTQTTQAQQSASTASTAATQAQATTASATTTTSSRQMTVNDVQAQLSSMQLPPTQTNVNILLQILQSGLPVTKENITDMLALTEGTNKSQPTLDAATVAITKGLNDSKEAVRVLTSQFSESPSMTSQISSSSSSLASVLGSLSNIQNMPPQLLAALQTLLTQYMANLGELEKKYMFGTDKSNSINREDMINDLRGLKSLLDGVNDETAAKQSQETPENEVMKQTIRSASKQLEGLLENMTSQAILSQNPENDFLGQKNYAYYQIPNTMIKPPGTVDIMIQKDKGKEGKIDAENSHLVIGLETEGLGKLTIAVTLKDKDIKIIFNTEQEETRKLCEKENISLKKGLSDKGYIVKECQSRVNKSMCSIKPFLIPKFKLDDFFRIETTI